MIFTAFVILRIACFGTGVENVTYLLAMLLLSMAEPFYPGFHHSTVSKKQRWFVNLSLTLMTAIVVSIPTIFVYTAMAPRRMGVFYWLSVPNFVAVICSVLALDLLFYLLHHWVHVTPVMWRSHRVHHCDRAFDVSSAGRDHVFMALFLGVARALLVLILGIPPSGFNAYLLLVGIILPFIHTNIAVPQWLDRTIGLVFITPSIHYIHHSTVMKETNSNYGTMFIFWDKIFGTYRAPTKERNDEIEVGIKEFPNAQQLTIPYLLLLPFDKKI